MEKGQEQSKKCFCARCFLPIEAEDKVDIDGQNFHRICSMCCICRTIPPALKMFYGHVFCNDCFKTHVLTRFRGENPRIHSNSWWMQWAPGNKPQEGASETKDEGENKSENPSEDSPKRCICARCLQMIDEGNKTEIGGQSFHSQCAKCYFCHTVPTSNLKIYYGQVFCEECFNRHVLNRNKDNPSDFFKHCFEQWQNNAQFADTMRDFMAGNKEAAPFVFMMQGPQPPFCRCGTGPQEWFPSNEPKKSGGAPASIGGDSYTTWDLSFENRTETSDVPDSCAIYESANATNEKIEKLTKYLHENAENCTKKWKNFKAEDTCHGWMDLQPKRAEMDCPRCLWQCGSVYVNCSYLKREVCYSEVSTQ